MTFWTASGAIEQWLQGGDEGTINRVLWLLTFVQKERSERTAELLSRFAGSSEVWNTRLAGLFTRSDIAASRAFFDFVLTLISTGAVDGMLYPGRGGDHFWLPVEKVVKSHPDWICELIAAYLERLLLVVGGPGNGEEFPLEFSRQSTGEQVIADAANSAPQRFVELLLPRMISMMETYAYHSHGPPWPDRVWGHGVIAREDGLDNRLLAGLEFSLCWMALNDPDQFRAHANSLKESEFATAQNLLLRSYAVASKLFADEAVGYLLEDPKQRFSIGYVSTSSVHAAEYLVGAVTPFCCQSNMAAWK